MEENMNSDLFDFFFKQNKRILIFFFFFLGLTGGLDAQALLIYVWYTYNKIEQDIW